MLRITLRLAAVLVLSLLIGACGGKKTEPTAAATARGATGAAGVPVTGVKFCGDWAGLAAQTAKVQGQPTGSAAEIKTSFEATNAYMKALADQAPADIKGDFQVYAKFWSDYVSVMAKANYDFSKMATDPELQKAMQAMSDPKLQQATVNIQNWMQKNCVAGR